MYIHTCIPIYIYIWLRIAHIYIYMYIYIYIFVCVYISLYNQSPGTPRLRVGPCHLQEDRALFWQSGAAEIHFWIQSYPAVFFSTFLAKYPSLLTPIYQVYESFCRAWILGMGSVKIMLPCRREHNSDGFALSNSSHVWHFFRLLVLILFGVCLSARTKLFWSLLAIFLFILIHQGVLLGRSFASMLSLLCLLVPVWISWSASARESFLNRHKTSPRWTPSMTLKLPFAQFGGPSVVHAMPWLFLVPSSHTAVRSVIKGSFAIRWITSQVIPDTLRWMLRSHMVIGLVRKESRPREARPEDSSIHI